MVDAGQDCSRYQYECHNIDRPTLSECIAVYDACDGVVQCTDGSDEMSCSDHPGLFCALLSVAVAPVNAAQFPKISF